MLKHKRGTVACSDSRMCISAPQKHLDQDKKDENDPTSWLGKLILVTIRIMSGCIIFRNNSAAEQGRHVSCSFHYYTREILVER